MLPATDDENRLFFRKIIPAYAFALREHLNTEKIRTELFDEEKHKHLFQQIDTEKHVPNQLALLMFRTVQQLYKDGIISGDQLIVLNAEMQSFTDICGGCERIKNTPIPFSHSVFIKKFIFFYVMTLPIGYVFNLGYYVIPVVAFVFYVLASLELIAEEIEDPFGNDSNDLPTKKIAETISVHVAELI
jgi:putative membrane protein